MRLSDLCAITLKRIAKLETLVFCHKKVKRLVGRINQRIEQINELQDAIEIDPIDDSCDEQDFLSQCGVIKYEIECIIERLIDYPP